MHLDHIISPVRRTFMTSSVLLSLAAMLTAAPPTPPSPEQLEDLARLTAPIGNQAKQHRQQALKSVNASEQRSAAADAVMKPFLKGIGQDTLLAQNNTPAPSATPATTPTAPPTASPGGKSKNNSKPAAKKEQPSTIKVEFDGGFYFDGKAGVLAYLKNIRLTESGSSFKLRCRDELKVFLDTPPEDPVENKDPKKDPKKEPKKEPKKKDKSFAELGDLKQIIATGDVKIVGQNQRGQPFLASGDIASYDATTGEIILRGGRPTLQQSANQYLKAQDPGQLIKIQMKDKNIQSIITSDGKWIMETTTKQTKP